MASRDYSETESVVQGEHLEPASGATWCKQYFMLENNQLLMYLQDHLGNRYKFVADDVLPGGWANQWSTSFDDLGAYVTLGSPAELSFLYNQEWSISLWVNVPLGANYGVIVSKSEKFVTRQYELYNNSNGILRAYIGGVMASSNIDIRGLGWQHAVLSVGGQIARIYINGQEEAVQSISSASSDVSLADVLFGARRSTGTSGLESLFDGNIDEVSFWGSNLTGQQVLDIYNNGQPSELISLPFASSLISYYRMGDDDTHPVIQDVVGGYDGTMVGMTPSNFEPNVP